MAKDGTRRGGARPGAGRPKKNKGQKPQKTESVLNSAVSSPALSDVEKAQFPACREQLRGTDAEDIYYSIYKFAKDCNADKQLPQELVELFAMSYYRWADAEKSISKDGVISKHPTTGAPCKSPLVSVSDQYSKQAQNYWYAIWSIIKGSEPIDNNDDDMADLLD